MASRPWLLLSEGSARPTDTKVVCPKAFHSFIEGHLSLALCKTLLDGLIERCHESDCIYLALWEPLTARVRRDYLQALLPHLQACEQPMEVDRDVQDALDWFSKASAVHRKNLFLIIVQSAIASSLALFGYVVDIYLYDQRRCILPGLPDEIVRHCLEYLDASSLCTLRRLNKRWSVFASDAYLWRRLCHQTWSRSQNFPLTMNSLVCDSWRDLYTCRVQAERLVSNLSNKSFSFLEAYMIDIDWWSQLEAFIGFGCRFVSNSHNGYVCQRSATVHHGDWSLSCPGAIVLNGLCEEVFSTSEMRSLDIDTARGPELGEGSEISALLEESLFETVNAVSLNTLLSSPPFHFNDEDEDINHLGFGVRDIDTTSVNQPAWLDRVVFVPQDSWIQLALWNNSRHKTSCIGIKRTINGDSELYQEIKVESDGSLTILRQATRQLSEVAVEAVARRRHAERHEMRRIRRDYERRLPLHRRGVTSGADDLFLV